MSPPLAKEMRAFSPKGCGEETGRTSTDVPSFFHMKLTRALGLQHFLEASDIKIGWYLPVDRSRTNELVLVSL